MECFAQVQEDPKVLGMETNIALARTDIIDETPAPDNLMKIAALMHGLFVLFLTVRRIATLSCPITRSDLLIITSPR